MAEPLGWASDYIDVYDRLIQIATEHPGYASPRMMLEYRVRRQHYLDVAAREMEARRRSAEGMRPPVIDPLADPNGAHRAEQMLEHTADVLAWYR